MKREESGDYSNERRPEFKINLRAKAEILSRAGFTQPRREYLFVPYHVHVPCPSKECVSNHNYNLATIFRPILQMPFPTTPRTGHSGVMAHTAQDVCQRDGDERRGGRLGDPPLLKIFAHRRSLFLDGEQPK